LVERLNGIEEVSGSNPLGSTTLFGGPFLCGTAFFIYFSAEYVRAVRQLRIAVHTTVYKRAKNMSFESADAQICEMRRKALVANRVFTLLRFLMSGFQLLRFANVLEAGDRSSNVR
jgi:hypothetical protein